MLIERLCHASIIIDFNVRLVEAKTQFGHYALVLEDEIPQNYENRSKKFMYKIIKLICSYIFKTPGSMRCLYMVSPRHDT